MAGIVRLYCHAHNIIKGNFRVNSKEDIPEALEALKDRPLYAEKWAYFKMVSICPGASLLSLADTFRL
jgi:hypothetical protein